MDWTVWASFAVVSALNIITPGPANLNTVRRAVQLGAIRVVPTIVGNALGLAVGGVFCAAGVATMLMASPALWTLFQWLGVGYILALGIKLLIKKDQLVLNGPTLENERSLGLFTEAFVLASTNPKALLFYIALFPQTIDPHHDLGLQASILIATYCLLSIFSLSSYATIATLLRARLMTQQRYDRFRQGSGLLLIGFASNLLWDLVSTLPGR